MQAEPVAPMPQPDRESRQALTSLDWIAVGIIDGFVYAGTAVMSLTYGIILPAAELDSEGHIAGATTDPDNWVAWPLAMIPVAFIGLMLALRLWNAKPQPKKKAAS